MTQEEIDKLFAQNEKIAKAREAEEKKGTKEKKSTRSTNESITFVVDGALLELFKEKVAETRTTQSAVLRAAVLSFAFGGLEFRVDRLKSANPEYNCPGDINSSVTQEHRGPGRPPKEKVPEPKKKLSVKEEQALAYKTPGAIPNNERTYMSYVHPQVPEMYDPKPSLQWDTCNAEGVTFEQFFKDHYFPFRSTHDMGDELNDPDDWFDKLLETYAQLIANKFIEDNNLNFRYRKDDMWGEVVNLDAECFNEHANELRAIYKYLRA